MSLILFIFFITFNSAFAQKNLIFIDNSVTNDTYIPSNKKKQVENAFRMAVSDLKKMYPSCGLITEEAIGRSNPLHMLEQSKALSKKNGNTFLVGMIHSSEALLGAKAFKDKNILGLSSGAATDSLNNQNSSFYSLANSVTSMTGHIDKFISSKKIKKILAVVPGNSSYSIELAKSLSELCLKRGLHYNTVIVDIQDNSSISEELKTAGSYDLIYVPGFLQQTLPIFQFLSRVKFKGIIYGSANLARSKPDLQLFSKVLNIADSKVMFPATWINGETALSRKLEGRYISKFDEEIMGTAVYTYDAALIAGTYLCTSKVFSSKDFENFVASKILTNSLATTRRYYGFKSGHFQSKIITVRFDLKSHKFISEFNDE